MENQIEIVSTTLKPHILEELKKINGELNSQVSRVANVSNQSVRLWAIKNDIRLLAYPVIVKICNYYNYELVTDALLEKSNDNKTVVFYL